MAELKITPCANTTHDDYLDITTRFEQASRAAAALFDLLACMPLQALEGELGPDTIRDAADLGCRETRAAREAFAELDQLRKGEIA